MWERLCYSPRWFPSNRKGKKKEEKWKKIDTILPLGRCGFYINKLKENASNIQIPEPGGHAVFTQISELKPGEVTVLDEIISGKTPISFLLTVADMQTLTGIAFPLLPSFLQLLP